MSAPADNGHGPGDNPLPDLAALSVDNLSAAQRRLAIARAARENATQEEIEARGIRPDVQQIVRHMSDNPFHSIKRARLGRSTVQMIFRSDDGNDEEEGQDQDRDWDRDRGHDRNRQVSLRKEEQWDEDRWKSFVAGQGLHNSSSVLLAEYGQVARQRITKLQQSTTAWDALHRRPSKKQHFDLILELSIRTELMVEVCKYLRPIDIVNLYSTSRAFHCAISQNMRSSVFTWAAVMAPTSARIYSSPVYCHWFIPDPAGRTVTAVDKELSETQPGQAKLMGGPEFNTVEGEVRKVPGLLWLQMVVNREIRVRDIIATLARMGHRLPKDAHLTLKKLWVCMDVATSKGRMILLNNPDFFSNKDLYMAQMFMVKLVLAFNDPVFGPQSSMLMRLMMGQRGLSPLWALLRGKKYRTPEEIRQLKLRYDVGPDQVPNPEKYGLEVDELGVIHFEGWGTGRDHLMRPDELVPLEAARRQLELDRCIENMMIYGHVDLRTGNSLVPSLDEMYMSDDELPPAHRDWTPLRHELINGGCGNVPFAASMWKPKHARKARWKTLTEEERAMILEEEQCEMEELKELEDARAKFETVRLQFDSKVRRAIVKQLPENAKAERFRLLPPVPCDFRDQLPALVNPPRDPDTMDIDSNPDSDPETSNPCSPRFSPLRLRRSRPSWPCSASSANPPNQDMDADMDTDIDFTDEDLTLVPIPRTELQRIYAAFRTPRGPHSEPDEEDDEDVYTGYDDDDDGNDGQSHEFNTHDDSPLAPSTQTQTPRPPSASSSSSSSPSSDEEGRDQGLNLRIPGYRYSLPLLSPYGATANNPNTNNYNILLTPATTVSTDDMLLAQADLEYSDGDSDSDSDSGADNDDGEATWFVGTMDADGQNGNGSGNGQRSVDIDVDMHGDLASINRVLEGPGQAAATRVVYTLDWNDFLRNPGAYVVEDDGEDGLAGGNGGGVGDGPVAMMAGGGNFAGGAVGGGAEGDEDEEEGDDDGFGEEDDNDVVVAGDGAEAGQEGAGGAEVFEEEEEDEEGEDEDESEGRDRVDDLGAWWCHNSEEVYEDDLTRTLRDWFRPW